MNSIPFLDSQVIRAMLLALASLIGMVVTKLGYTFDDAFYAQLVDAGLLLLTTASAVWAMWARATKPNPPITETGAKAVQLRELDEQLRKEGGFIRLPILAGTALLGLLVACGTLGLPAAKTTSERIAVGYSTVTQVRESATTLLQARVITADDAQNVQQQADTARSALDIARTLRAVDPAAADAKLIASLQILQAIEAYLRSRQP